MTVRAIDLMMDGPHAGARSPVERVGDCGGGEDGFVRKSFPGQCQKVRREPGVPGQFWSAGLVASCKSALHSADSGSQPGHTLMQSVNSGSLHED